MRFDYAVDKPDKLKAGSVFQISEKSVRARYPSPVPVFVKLLQITQGKALCKVFYSQSGKYPQNKRITLPVNLLLIPKVNPRLIHRPTAWKAKFLMKQEPSPIQADTRKDFDPKSLRPYHPEKLVSLRTAIEKEHKELKHVTDPVTIQRRAQTLKEMHNRYNTYKEQAKQATIDGVMSKLKPFFNVLTWGIIALFVTNKVSEAFNRKYTATAAVDQPEEFDSDSLAADMLVKFAHFINDDHSQQVTATTNWHRFRLVEQVKKLKNKLKRSNLDAVGKDEIQYEIEKLEKQISKEPEEI